MRNSSYKWQNCVLSYLSHLNHLSINYMIYLLIWTRLSRRKTIGSSRGYGYLYLIYRENVTLLIFQKLFFFSINHCIKLIFKICKINVWNKLINFSIITFFYLIKGITSKIWLGYNLTSWTILILIIDNRIYDWT